MNFERMDWGYSNGYKVYCFKLVNNNGMSVTVTNFGAAIVNIFVPDRQGNFADVVLGYDNLAGYERGGSSQGAIIGRYANRIKKGRFDLNGKTYQLNVPLGAPDCLHGGVNNFGRRVWEVKDVSMAGSPSVTLSYFSIDMEEGFPANVRVTICYTLTDENELKLDYYAVSDGDTVINLTNHSYFNLKGYDGGNVKDTEIEICANKYSPVDKDLLPIGLAAVKGTAFDFTTPKTIGKAFAEGLKGIDHNFFLGEPHVMRKAAVAVERTTGRTLTVTTDMPALQFYTANGLDEISKNYKHVSNFDAFCFETQFCPDSPNMPEFPTTTLKSGDKYHFTSVFKFGIVE